MIEPGSARREALAGLRFGIVGVAASITHFGVLTALLSLAGAGPVIANTIAYVLALCVSFTGHHFWTFRATGPLLASFLRFLGASGGAYLASTLLLVVLIRDTALSDAAAALAAVAVMPLITFAAHRLWVFRKRGG